MYIPYTFRENNNKSPIILIAMSSGVLEGNISLTKEPEMGREPSGPDQSLPIPANPSHQNPESGSTSIVRILLKLEINRFYNFKL